MPIDMVLRRNRKTGAELTAPHKALSSKRRAPEEIAIEKHLKSQKKAAEKAKEDERQKQLQQLLVEFQDGDEDESPPPAPRVTNMAKRSHMRPAPSSDNDGHSSGQHDITQSEHDQAILSELIVI